MRAQEFIIESTRIFAKGDRVQFNQYNGPNLVSNGRTSIDKLDGTVTDLRSPDGDLVKVMFDGRKRNSVVSSSLLTLLSPITEGGWEDTITQKTKLNPAVVRRALKAASIFFSDFNKFLHARGEEPVKMGSPLGSTAYVNVDTDNTEYGDVDLQAIAPEVEGKSVQQIGKHYNGLIDQFIASQKPSYIYSTGKPTSGHPIFSLGNDMHVQIDMLWTTQRLSKWDRYRKTPMQGIKGLIMGNLYSTLGEVINMSLQSAVLMKMKGGEPLNYQRGRKPDEVLEITIDIEQFGLDILKHVYNAVNGTLDGIQLDPLLKANPGTDIKKVDVAQVINTVKGLARSFELNDLFGKYNLKEYSNAEEMLNNYLRHYLDKADKAGKDAKLDKATTPDELAQVDLLRSKIAKGVKLVKQAFAES